MANIFREALEILKKARSGAELTEEERSTLTAAQIPLDHVYSDIPLDEALEKLANLLDPLPYATKSKSWLVDGCSGGNLYPLIPNIRLDGRIAELIRHPRRPHRCKECGLAIEVFEPYYAVTWGGAGLGSIKFPARVHVACLAQHLNQPVTEVFLEKVWGVMIDYGYAHCAELEKKGRLAGYVAATQRVWTKMREVEKCLVSVRNVPSARS